MIPICPTLATMTVRQMSDTLAEVTADRSFSPSRLARLRSGLTRAEWWRVGGMVTVVLVLNVLGWGMLSAAAGCATRI